MRILLIRLSSFGDVVFTLPAAKALKTAFPSSDLAWAVEEPLAPLLLGAPYVDRVFTTRTRTWRRSLLSGETRREIRDFLRAARAFAPDLIVDAQGLFKSAWATFLVPAGRKVGFGFKTAAERVDCLVTDERVDPMERRHVADRAIALAEHVAGRSGFDRVPDVSHLVSRPAPEVDACLSGPSAPFALLQPFSSRAAKEWPAAEAAAFARRIRETGFRTIVRWGPGERERAEEIVRASEGAAELAPATDPATTARLAARAALFVGADTGPTHLAAAAGTPTLALFGPTDPERFGPLGPRVAVLRAPGADYNPGTDLARLTSDVVHDAALRLLA